MKSKRSKACAFSQGTVARIISRDDDCCIFCIAERWPVRNDLGMSIKDIVHIINRSQGGLGIEKNGVTGCRNHHQLLDNGNQGVRAEMLEYAKDYLRERYPD